MAAKPDIHHRTPGGDRHPGRAAYCHLCTPPPNPTALPVVPATRRGDYAAPVITTGLADRDLLVRLCEAGPYTAPACVDPIPDPAIGDRVLFKIGQNTWRAGVVETKGYAGTRVSYVATADLTRARRDKVPTEVRRHRPHAMWALP